ncbi:MAG: BamA/TamA family outer membrane protein [Microbacteriaceae bacterium]|nr:BamA/TamA family outer membrane protein [Burkholderiaceae bacterium]
MTMLPPRARRRLAVHGGGGGPGRPSAAWWALLGLVMSGWLLTSGCSQVQPLIAAFDTTARPTAPPLIDLKVDAPDALKPLLEKHLDLARLGLLRSDETPSAGEINRLIAAAPAQARELLQTEGYFDAQVTVQRSPLPSIEAGARAAAAPGDSAASPAPAAPASVADDDPALRRDRLQVVRVTVVPGDPTQVGALQIRTEGELQARVERGDVDAIALQHGLAAVSTLQPGMVFRNPDWSASKQALQARVRAAGYAAVRIQDSRAAVDATARTAQLRVLLDSGPLFLTGPLQISGLQHHDEQTVRNLAGFEAGEPLTETRLLDFQDRLQAARLFQAATVTIEPDPQTAAETAGTTPVRVRLVELPLQQATVGVGVTSNSGARATAEHTHRRPFDWPVIAYNKLEYGQRIQKFSSDIQTHPGPRFFRNLLGLQIEHDQSATDTVLSQQLRLGRTQDTPRSERLQFVELLRSRREALTPLASDAAQSADSGPSTATALSINAHQVWRDLDSVLLPTRGWVLSVQGGVGESTSHGGATGPFTRLYTRMTGYLPLGGQWYSQARLEVGSVLHRGEVEVPDSLGFRAGGEDSVRGYGYRELAPTDASGATISGDVLLTTSLELARPIMASMPSVWGAVFIDAGRAAKRWTSFTPALGYGVGVRWRSPIGPLRVDLAYGDEVKRFRLHFSVGITF